MDDTYRIAVARRLGFDRLRLTYPESLDDAVYLDNLARFIVERWRHVPIGQMPFRIEQHEGTVIVSLAGVEIGTIDETELHRT